MGMRCAVHATPLYPQKLALTSLKWSGHSAGIVRLQTEGHGFSKYLGKYLISMSVVTNKIDRHLTDSSVYVMVSTNYIFV
jgi:hypothetical protein